jgi:hypothetical protein
MNIENNHINQADETTKDQLHQRLNGFFEHLKINLKNEFRDQDNSGVKMFQSKTDRQIFVKNGVNDLLCATLFNDEISAPFLISMAKGQNPETICLTIRNLRFLSDTDIMMMSVSNRLTMRVIPGNYPTLRQKYKSINAGEELKDCSALIRTAEAIAKQGGLIAQ